MALRCPNKNHPDWKALVEKHGEDKAIDMYIENDYDIPNIDGSKKKGKVTIDPQTNIYGDYYSSKSTLDSLDRHPNVISKMIEKIKELFPFIRIDIEGFKNDFDKSQHFNSIKSAIGYANDSYTKEPPTEYIDNYLDMFEDTPIVSGAIDRFGSKDALKKAIGRSLQGKKMSSSFNDFYDGFWKQVRGTFGSPTVSDILTDSFSKNENMTKPVSQGTSIKQYDEIKDPMLGKSDSIAGFNDSTENSSEYVAPVSTKEALNQIYATLGLQFDWLNDAVSQIKRFDKFWTDLTIMIDIFSRDESGKSTDYAGISSNRVNKTAQILSGEEKVKINIIAKLKGEDIKLTKEEQQAYDTIVDLSKAYLYKQKANENYFEGDGNMVSKKVVEGISNKEANETMTKTEENIASKHPALQYVAKWVRKGLRHVTNTRLWAKYLSGGENTMISRILYKAFNNARVPYSQFLRDFENHFKNENTPNSYLEGSVFAHPDATIDELTTETISLDKTLNSDIMESEVKLTKAELLYAYLTSRQEGGKEDLLEGIYLSEVKGRRLPLDTKIKLSNSQWNSIVAKIENDKDAMTFVEEIDKAMIDSHSKLNKTFQVLEGYSIPLIRKYFPKYHGAGIVTVKKTKNIIEDQRAMKERTGGGAIKLADPFQVLSNMKMTNASYVAYAIPVSNAKKLIKNLKGKFKHRDDAKYISHLEGTIDKVQDPEALFSTQGEQDLSRIINRVQGNFAVALLAKNLGVVLKQQVSLETARTEINGKYLRQSGPSLFGMVNLINPLKLFKQLSLTGFKEGETWMPVEWKQLTDNALYQELIKHPLFRDRFEGMVSRESGEAIMGKNIGDDKVKIPFLKDSNGKPVTMTKSRLMMGITIMDTMTILRLYNAVKLETADRMGEPGFANLTEAQIEEHNVSRLQQIVDKTQPTFDQTNRTGLARDSNPIWRAMTMFSSATSKMSMQLIDSAIDYANNPTSENGKKFAKRVFHTAITTSAMLIAIDFIWHGLTHAGWDDDDWDSLPEKLMWGSAKTTIGAIHVVGTAWGVMESQLDSNPWYKTSQDPMQHILQEGAEGAANLAKGNWFESAKQILNAYAKTKGLPVTPYNKINTMRKESMKK